MIDIKVEEAHEIKGIASGICNGWKWAAHFGYPSRGAAEGRWLVNSIDTTIKHNADITNGERRMIARRINEYIKARKTTKALR